MCGRVGGRGCPRLRGEVPIDQGLAAAAERQSWEHARVLHGYPRTSPVFRPPFLGDFGLGLVMGIYDLPFPADDGHVRCRGI